jgi:hypothetical protein
VDVRPGCLCDIRSMSLYAMVGGPHFSFCNHTIIINKIHHLCIPRDKRVWGDMIPREAKGDKGLMRGA